MTRPHEDELRAIDEFFEFVERIARTPLQRERTLGAAQVPLSAAGLAALRLISREGPIAVTEVARQLGVDQSTASRQIRPLEDAGLIARTADDADRRVAWLALTDAGHGVLDRIHGQRRDDIDLVLTDWPARDRAQLARLLDRLRDSMIRSRERQAEAS